MDASVKKNKVYVKFGLTLLLVGLLYTICQVIFNDLPGFFNVISDFLKIISPILYGILFAYLMNPIMQLTERLLVKGLCLVYRNQPARCAELRTSHKGCHIVGVVAALAVLLAVFYLAIVLVVPTIIDNVTAIFTPDTFIGYYNRVNDWLQKLFSDNPEIETWALERLNDIYANVEELISNIDFSAAFVRLTTQVYGVVKGTLNFLIGLVVAVYMLLSKDTFLAQLKKLVVALWSEPHANRLLEVGGRVNKIFSGFVMGKIIDSLIIGVMCYLGMLLLSLPYPVLISVIIGVTNVIPFFGPLVGAIPSALLILLTNPLQCFIFIIFVVCLQQFDGNILGPRILGDSVGLSSFWILISITVFSGLFGFAGMVLGVPVFATIYMLVSDWVKRRLTKKGLPLTTALYSKVHSTEDLDLAQRMAERSSPHPDTYEQEPEIIEIEKEEE